MVVHQVRAHRDFSVYFSEGGAASGSDSGSEPDSPLPLDTTLRVGDRVRYQVSLLHIYLLLDINTPSLSSSSSAH
jgi:hypothetical protein